MSDEHDVHPLDRDYTVPTKLPPAPTVFNRKLRRFGFVSIAAGFLTLIPAAILLGDPRTVGPNEPLGNRLHQLAMILILMGGILVVAAYRLPAIREKQSGRPKKRSIAWTKPKGFVALLVGNVIFFVMIAFLYNTARWTGSQIMYSILLNGLMTITSGLMVTMAFCHRGMLRGFAIGIMTGLLINFMMFFNLLGQFYRGGSASYWFLSCIAIIQISGLVCAGYVALVHPADQQK